MVPTVGSLILYLLSALKGVDILNRIGFKKRYYMVSFFPVCWYQYRCREGVGLGMEDKTNAFYLFLGAYFIIALGFSLQQTAANLLLFAGRPRCLHRLNFAGGVN